MSLLFVVSGLPAPQGSKRHVGNGIMVEQSKKVGPWRDSVTGAIHDQHTGTYPAQPALTPLDVNVVFTLPAPKSLPKTRPSHPVRTPDLDKLIRSTMDALTISGIWDDDARAVTITATKTYPASTIGAHPDALAWPGAVITITKASPHIDHQPTGGTPE